MDRGNGSPDNYVKANPENIQALVRGVFTFGFSYLMFTQVDDLYEGGKLKTDAKFVYIDTADFLC